MSKKAQSSSNQKNTKGKTAGLVSGTHRKTRGGAKKPSGKSSSTISTTRKLQGELQECKEKYLRLSAEFDNFRKRTLREKADLMKFAGEDFILGLLPVLDDFDRAVQSMDQSKDANTFRDGIMLIYNKFGDFLKQKGIKEIECMHTDFDTDLHDAVTKIPAPKPKLKGKVVDVITRGYELNGKVIRHSKVVIGE